MKLFLNEPRLLIRNFEKLFSNFPPPRELSKRYTFLSYKYLNLSRFYSRYYFRFYYQFSFFSNRFLLFFDSGYRNCYFNDYRYNVYRNEMIIFLIDAHFLYF